ncbi:MAG: YraN family protein [Oscillospiraceae bacterium]|nr:YraN family protein [Oscillospiraceae bacterium]
MDRKAKGQLGEDAAAAELMRRGHRIIGRNYRQPCGEIDIISEIGGFIVFTEVKTRGLNSMVSGVEAVDPRKRSRIVRTADLYLSEHETGLQPRYDIAEVTISRGSAPRILRIDIYEDAFDTEGIYTVN